MVNLVEIGNSHVKMLDRKIKTSDFDINDFIDEDNFIISSVVPELLNDTVKKLKKENKKFFVIDEKAPFSFEHDLTGVGVDRLLLVEGALSLAKAPLVAISFGTAITLNFVINKSNRVFFEGGLIMPGIGLQLDVLNKRTAQLPNITKKEPAMYVAKNTEDAMNNGVLISVVNGIEGAISRAELELGVKFEKIFISGGDADFFSKVSSLKLELVDDLVFKGMESVYKRKGVKK